MDQNIDPSKIGLYPGGESLELRIICHIARIGRSESATLRRKFFKNRLAPPNQDNPCFRTSKNCGGRAPNAGTCTCDQGRHVLKGSRHHNFRWTSPRVQTSGSKMRPPVSTCFVHRLAPTPYSISLN